MFLYRFFIISRCVIIDIKINIVIAVRGPESVADHPRHDIAVYPSVTDENIMSHGSRHSETVTGSVLFYGFDPLFLRRIYQVVHIIL